MEDETRRELHVAILGAGGTIAPAVVRDLTASEEVGEMTLLDVCALVTQHELAHLSQLRNLIALLPEG